MLKPLVAATATLALWSLPLHAQTAAPPAPGTAPATAPASTAATTDADPALWVVKDADTTIYLFGTVHVLKPGLSWFDEAVKTAFDKSDTVVLEMVLPEQAEAQAAVMKAAVNTTGPTLTERLPEANRKAYADAMTGLGLPATAFDRFDPWFAASNLTLVTIGKAGYDPASGAEMTITAAAKAAGKPVEGLETLEQQFGFFDGLSEKSQIAFLTETVEELPRATETIDTMVAQWSAGQTDALADTLNEGMEATPEIAKVLLTDRNQRWADWIATRMQKPGTVFIAVGAGHLAGAGSVQDALKARRITAERVRY